MKNKFRFLLSVLFLLAIVSCAKEEINTKQDIKMTAINVSGDTDNADILLLCDNGSYIICDVENEDGYCVIYMNESVDGDFENGLTIFLDESGMPVMASSHNGHFVFKDVTDENFDFAFINNKDEVSYYNAKVSHPQKIPIK